MSITEDPKIILIPDVFFEMCRSGPQSKSIAIKAAQSARVAYSTQNVLDYLNKAEVINRQMTAEEQQHVCDIIWHCMFEATHDTILQYVTAIPDEEMEDLKDIAYDC